MNNKIIVALDNNDLNKVLSMISELKKEAFAFKIGYEFFLTSVLMVIKFCKKKI